MLPWQKCAYIWMSRKRIYILKVQKNWYGACINCQGSMFNCQDGWQDCHESLEKQICRIIDVYGLTEYRLYLLVGGAELICRSVVMPVKTKKEARSMVVWEEVLGDGSRLYSFDVYRRKHNGSKTEHPAEWLIAAYPYEQIVDILSIFQQQRCCISKIDALPALAGRFISDGNGILYIYESSQIHVIMLYSGEPLSYTCVKEWPPEGKQQLNKLGIADSQDEIILWHDETNDLWRNQDFASQTGKKAQRWALNGIVALLTAF